MTLTLTPTPTVAKISISPITWFGAGTRPTRQTWVATLVLDDGTEVDCPHTRGGHRNIEQATACGRKIASQRRSNS